MCVGVCLFVSVCRCLYVCHLKGLDEGPQQDTDGVSLPQQLDETSCSEQPQKTQIQKPVLQDQRQEHSQHYTLFTGDNQNMTTYDNDADKTT